VALIENELVRRQALLPQGTIAEALTYTKLLPGSTVVQVVAYLGFRLGGWTTAAVCTAAFLLPSVLAMLALAYAYSQIPALPAVASIRRGVLAAVVGLLILTTYRLARSVPMGWLTVLVAVAALVAGMLAPVNIPWIMLAAGLVGVVLRRR
jgi:chromate transporter